ncbi:MAG: transforming acidic coiled-coil-containing protein [Paludibacteraceae bacterium]|nr:transforming acidic coiled-coil-containing protein [Paludibacteraceae bacterium]
MGLKDLLGLGNKLSQDANSTTSTMASQNNNVFSSLGTSNTEQRVQGETWQQYGFRMGGKSTGSTNVLAPLLSKVTYMMLEEQKNDFALQQKVKQEKENLLNDKISEKKTEEGKLKSAEESVSDLLKENESLKKDINKLQSGEAAENKEAKMKMIIGLLILIPFTLYFFIFYSSAAYSAFFANFSGEVEEGLNVTIFNAKALPLAFGQSFMTGLFVLMITFLVFALGFVLHYMDSMAKKVGLVLITFMFDFLLAVEIEQQIYNAQALAGLYGPNPPAFTMATALSEVNVWMVICCGFVGYIIWGLLFGFVMESYNELKSNKYAIMDLKGSIEANNEKIQTLQTEIAGCKSKIGNLDAEITNLQNALKSGVLSIDKDKILQELANFYAGWTNFLASLGATPTVLEESNLIYNNAVNSVKSNL